MAIYVYKKVSGYYRSTLLGEEQNGFNMSFSIDGTKDSAKLNVRAYQKLDLKPYDIIEHRNTNTWWVVASDRIDRFENENGFYYDHQLSLVGAIELLNAIDLTDCAFLSNRYTLREVLERLEKLALNIDIPQFQLYTNSAIDLDTVVNYTKTFENYTLLSALREVMDGYNCSLKLTFSKSATTNPYLNYTNIIIVPKTGDGTIVNDSLFNLVDEKTNINKNNYGTSVVSNAQNVISSKAKTYPAVGSVRLSANSYEIKRDTAILRLPNKVYDINWVKMYVPLSFRVYCFADGIDQSFKLIVDKTQSNKKIVDFMNNIFTSAGVPIPSRFTRYDLPELINKLDKASSVVFYGGTKYDSLNDVVYPADGTKTPMFIFGKYTEVMWYHGPVYLMEKHLWNSVNQPDKAEYFWWERGTDTLSNFRFAREAGDATLYSHIHHWQSTQLQASDFDVPNDLVLWERTYGTRTIRVFIEFGNSVPDIEGDFDDTLATSFDISNIRFVVNYIPMTDMKIKYDNKGDRVVSKLYNQTGKITDSVAFSKLMLSHSKEIESDKITKYGRFFNFSNIPQTGNVVVIDNEKYVIGNVSLDFDENESGNYYIEGEFTLSKNIATKSLMVSPDTNIRDYNIPQNMNVKRVQLYKDFFEITHQGMSDRQTPRQDITNILNVGNSFKGYGEHTAVIKLDYLGIVGQRDIATPFERLRGIHNYQGGSYTWYYQLDSTTIPMKKAIYEIVDFKDNNIIGYDAMNTITGFKINEILTNRADTIATPVSYVDNYGRVKNVSIAFCNGNQLSTIYQNYLNNTAGGDSYDGNLINYSVFIDSKIYEGVSGTYDGAKDYNDFTIIEENYNKDALEVPVFEYCCQLDDTSDVVIGDDIFETNDDDFCYFYSMYLVDKGTIDNGNVASLQVSNVYEDDEGGLQLEEENIAIEMEIDGVSSALRYLTLAKYNTVGYEKDYGVVYSGSINFTSSQLANKDIVIIRHIIKNDYTVDGDANVSQQTQLMFVIRNTENVVIDNGKIKLQLNAYKVN